MFWQILAFVAAVVFAIWILGVGLISAFHPRVKGHTGNIFLGIPLVALAIWLPFAFGWVG